MKYIFRFYQWCIAVPILVVITAVTALTCIISALFGAKNWGGYWPPKLWSQCVCTLLFIRVKVEGRSNIESKQAYVFVSNHQSAFDIWSIYGYLGHPFKWMMKKSLEKVFLVGQACKSVGHVFVDDSSIAGIKDTISHAQSTLKGNMSLVIFPEGHRSYDGKMLPFKRGAFMLAGEFGLPVVPITIEGAYDVLPRSTYNIRPGKITLHIHKPIYPGEKGFNTKSLLNICRSEISASLPLKYQGEGKEPETESKVSI